MKTIIAGGRDYAFKDADYAFVDEIHKETPITEVVSGGALGADLSGETWAKRNGVPVKKFPADWERYGKGAGYIRNQHMADYADRLIIFPGGKGTADMMRKAKSKGLPIFSNHKNIIVQSTELELWKDLK